MAGPRRKDRRTMRDLFPPDLFVQRIYCTTKEEAIGELLNALVINGLLDLSREESTLQALLGREKVASTGIGNGVAIPHAKSKFAEKFGVAVGLSEDGIDFSAHDGRPARVVVLWICPPSATKEHLALMRAISSIARDPDLSDRLAGCRDRRGWLTLLEGMPADPKTG